MSPVLSANTNGYCFEHVWLEKGCAALISEKQVTVSVIMPTFNRGEAIRRSIDSVVNQRMGDWELIVVSDGSTDITEAIVSSYTDPRVRLIALEERSGHPSRPRNVGLTHAQGQLIAYLDHDDVYEPTHLECALRAFDDTGTDIVAVGARYEDEDGVPLGQTSVLDLVWHPEIQSIGPLFQPARVIHRRAVTDTIGGWDESPVGLEDWELWLRMADNEYRIHTIDCPTARIVMGNAQRSGNLPIKWSIPIATLASEHEVLMAHQALTSEEAMRVVAELNVEEATAWYRELWDAGELVLPTSPYRSRDITWNDILELIEDHQRRTALPPLRAKPREDGRYDIGIDLLVANETHAKRTFGIFSRRFPKKIAFIQSIIAGVHTEGVAPCPVIGSKVGAAPDGG